MRLMDGGSRCSEAHLFHTHLHLPDSTGAWEMDGWLFSPGCTLSTAHSGALRDRSSDRKTDRFTFQYTLVPPFEKEGTRVEFCLRYETSVGTFWANNKQMNYVLFFHQKVKQLEPQVQEELNNYKSKKSCLKFNR